MWEVSRIYDEYNKALNNYVSEVNEEETQVTPAILNREDFEMLITANEKTVTAGNLVLLEEILYA